MLNYQAVSHKNEMLENMHFNFTLGFFLVVIFHFLLICAG